MKTNWKSLLFFLFILLQTQVYAQIDTLFWFAAPEVSASAGQSPIYLRFMTYGDAADITVSAPAVGSTFPTQNITVPANSVDSINLTAWLASIESPAANVAANNGIKIVSTEKISVFYELKSASNKEIFTLKGNKALGDNFYTPFQKFWNNGVTAPASFSSIDIVATEDNTTVLITPRTNITGHVQDVTFSVILNEGQTYSARDMAVSASTSLAGSIVSSNKPIALTLFSGALANAACMSTMGDQITSEAYTGKKFIVHKSTSGNDRVYIMATQNGTNITINNSGTTTTLINWGETYEFSLSDDINHIATSKPVYVWHASGYGCELSGAQVPHVYCAGTYSTAFTRTTSDSLGLLLYTRTGFENQFQLNGNGALIPAGAFSPVPGTSGAYQVALIHYSTADVPINSYNEVTNAGDIFGLGVLNGNDGNGSSYGYLSEFSSYPFVNAGLDDTICANTSINLNGLVGGGSVTGVWSGTGFGSFGNPTNQLNNVYNPSPLDSLISPVELILTTTGPCPVLKDTLILVVDAAPIVSANANQTLCANASSVDLNGSVAGGATTGQWSTLGSGTFTPTDTTLNATYLPSAADLSAGSVQLILVSTDFGSCIAETDTMVVTFTPPPVVNAGPDTIYVCSNNPLVDLTGTVTGATTTGKWTSSGNGVFSPDNLDLNADYSPSPQDISGGSIWIYLRSTGNGNCVAVFDSVLVIFTPSPVVNAGSNFLACSNDAAISLNGVISGATTTGIWSGGAGVFTPNSTDLNATYAPTPAEILAGNLFLTLTSTNNPGCIDVNDNVQLTFIAPPTANFNYTEECLYDAAEFTDFSLNGYGNINSWAWDFGDLNTSSNPDVNHFYSAPGSYNVELIVTTDVGCTDTLVQIVNAYEVPFVDFDWTSDCPNNQIIVDFTDLSTTVSDPILTYFYDFGNGSQAGSPNPTQSFNGNQNYTIYHSVTTVNGCIADTTHPLSIPAYPVASFSYNLDNSSSVIADVDFINTSSNGTSYLWDLGTGPNSTEFDPSITYYSNDNYIVTLWVTSALGCVDSTSQVIQITNIVDEEDIVELIPIAISPNGDFKNDTWKLDFIEALYPDAQVQIFNEWGSLIFESIGYPERWDGTYNGKAVPDGTYFFVINLNNKDDDSDILKGALTVLKSKN